MSNKKYLEVSLDPNVDPAIDPAVKITPNPATVDGNKVRWIEAEDNEYPFSFAGIELDDDQFPGQEILVKKNRITCDNKNTSGTEEFNYVIWVRHGDKFYNSTDPGGDTTDGKAVIRNQ